MGRGPGTGGRGGTIRRIAVVPAAGLGKRFGPGGDKPFVPLMGRPLLYWTLLALERSPNIDAMVPVVKPVDRGRLEAYVAEWGFEKVLAIAPGGAERQHSVMAGLLALEGLGMADEDVALVHDGARPLLTDDVIARCLEGLDGSVQGTVAAVPVKDTVKAIGPDWVVVSTPPRETLMAVQTPQVFRYGVILEAYARAGADGFLGTDDAQLVERLGGRVRLTRGSYENLKITTPEDLGVAEMLLSQRGVRP